MHDLAEHRLARKTVDNGKLFPLIELFKGFQVSSIPDYIGIFILAVRTHLVNIPMRVGVSVLRLKGI